MRAIDDATSTFVPARAITNATKTGVGMKPTVDVCIQQLVVDTATLFAFNLDWNTILTNSKSNRLKVIAKKRRLLISGEF